MVSSFFDAIGNSTDGVKIENFLDANSNYNTILNTQVQQIIEKFKTKIETINFDVDFTQHLYQLCKINIDNIVADKTVCIEYNGNQTLDLFHEHVLSLEIFEKIVESINESENFHFDSNSTANNTGNLDSNTSIKEQNETFGDIFKGFFGALLMPAIVVLVALVVFFIIYLIVKKDIIKR